MRVRDLVERLAVRRRSDLGPRFFFYYGEDLSPALEYPDSLSVGCKHAHETVSRLINLSPNVEQVGQICKWHMTDYNLRTIATGQDEKILFSVNFGEAMRDHLLNGKSLHQSFKTIEKRIHSNCEDLWDDFPLLPKSVSSWFDVGFYRLLSDMMENETRELYLNFLGLAPFINGHKIISEWLIRIYEDLYDSSEVFENITRVSFVVPLGEPQTLLQGSDMLLTEPDCNKVGQGNERAELWLQWIKKTIPPSLTIPKVLHQEVLCPFLTALFYEENSCLIRNYYIQTAEGERHTGRLMEFINSIIVEPLVARNASFRGHKSYKPPHGSPPYDGPCACGIEVCVSNASDLLDPYLGETEKNVYAALRPRRKGRGTAEPCDSCSKGVVREAFLVIVTGIDRLVVPYLSVDNGMSSFFNRNLAAILTAIDGIDENPRVAFLFLGNREFKALPDALRRPGRIDAELLLM